jgi:hypothetical protein
VPRVSHFDGNESGTWVMDPVTGLVRWSVPAVERVGLTDFDGDGRLDLYGYRPASWNPRVEPEPGWLLALKPALATDDQEKGALPPPGPVAGLSGILFPWQSRPLPWAGQRGKVWYVGAGALVLFLGVLFWLRRRKTALGFALLAVLFSVGISLWLLYRDRAHMEEDQFYVWADWYGVGVMVAAVFAWLTAGCLVLLGLVTAVTSWSRRGRSAPNVPDAKEAWEVRWEEGMEGPQR